MAEPQFHQGHEDFATGEEGRVEVIGLLFPFLAELGADPLQEDGELIKFLFAVIEEIELGVVVNLMLLRPHVAGCRLFGRIDLASCPFLLVMHLDRV